MPPITKLSAVTGLYDLGRADVDGRAISLYLDWLNATLRLPIPFTIYLDPAIDCAKVHAKPGDTIVQIPLESFRPFSWRERLQVVLHEARQITATGDVTFNLPDYALFMYSKFEMVRRAAVGKTADEGIVWLDAGISRFFNADMATLKVDVAYLASLAGVSFAACITQDLARDLKAGKLSKDYVGTCQRLVTGCDFYFNATSADTIADQMMTFIETEWLANGLWDNEQVALGYLYMAGIADSKVIDISPSYGGVLARLLGNPPGPTRRKPSLVTSILGRLGFKRD